MEHWSTSRHSYAKPRLLGELKAEHVYLNLCPAHTFLSPAYNIFKQGKIIVDKIPSKMRELRESLRQAALINIVAAVNDGDKSANQSLNTDNIDNKANQYGLQDFLHKRTSVKLRSNYPTSTSTFLCPDRATAVPPLRNSRVPDTPHCEKQRLCPRLKLSDALIETFTKKELSILEGHRIESLKSREKSTKKKVNLKNVKSEVEVDLKVPTMPDPVNSRNNINKQQCVSSHQDDIINSMNRCIIKETTVSKSVHDSDIVNNRVANMPNISDLYLKSRQDKSRQKSGSSQESEGSSSNDSKDRITTIRDVLHISTTEKGDIGRTAGYFPPPSSKRDFTAKKQLMETRLPKCDAVDILDPTSSAGDMDYPMIFKSQRDNLGEMGTCLFGLARTNSRTNVPSKLKRKKKRQKRETEIIVLSAPIGRRSSIIDNLGDGIVGVNISSEATHDSSETKRHPSPVNEEKMADSADATSLSSSNKTNPQNATFSSDKFDNSIYHLDNTRAETSPIPNKTISLEGHAVPALPLREPKTSMVQPSNYPYLPNVRASVLTREQESSMDVDLDPQPHLSKQLYDFTSLCIGSDPSTTFKLQTIQQIQPTIRKAGVLPNNTSALYYTSRPRPINASMSACKRMDDITKNRVFSAPRTPEDMGRYIAGSNDLTICASKIEDLDSLRARSRGTQRDEDHPEVTIKNSIEIDDNGSYDSLNNENGINMDFLMDSESDSDVDITKFDPPKTPILKKNRTASVIAKHQGASSMNTNGDTLTKLHVIKDGDEGNKNPTVKILKSLDQDIYADFTHRKHRNSTFANNNDPNSSKVILVKVRCSTKDSVTNNEDNDHDTEDSDSDLS